MKTVLCADEASFTVEGSRFLSRLHPAATREEVLQIIRSVRKEHPKATHVVSACRLRNEAYCDDDGEPAQTAAAPMLALLEGEDIVDSLLICVRYFGGVKLGKGGLIRAYAEAGREAIRAASFLTLHYVQKIRLTYSYEDQRLVDYALAREKAFRGDVEYAERIHAAIYLPDPAGMREKFLDWTQGRGSAQEEDWVYIYAHNGQIRERKYE